MAGFSITRQIGIDVGHRVPTHGSKCWNLHGHRYTINATCQADALREDGVQTDMVLDFGFLKEIMMEKIDKYCDHGMVMWSKDPWLIRLIPDIDIRYLAVKRAEADITWEEDQPNHFLVAENRDLNQSKVLVVPFIPTAERLAEFWFQMMREPVNEASKGMATLQKVEVFETPNCSAVYPT